MPKKIEISHRTIIFTTLLLISLWFLYQLRQALLTLYIAIILMAALNPLVERLERIKIPRPIAILVIYIFIFGSFGLILAGIIPPLISQTSVFFSGLTEGLDTLKPIGIDGKLLEDRINQIISNFGALSAGVIRAVVGLFGNLFAFIAILVLGFYLLLERRKLDHHLLKLFGSGADHRAAKVVDKIEERLGKWVRAQLFLMIIVALLTYIGLRLLKIDFALPLAILAGILEIVPNIGPIISAIPGVLAGLAISPLMGLAVAAWYFLVQQLENHLIVPQVMAKGAGINPLVTILALVAGFNLGGVGGAFLALPVVILVEIIYTEFFASKLG